MDGGLCCLDVQPRSEAVKGLCLCLESESFLVLMIFIIYLLNKNKDAFEVSFNVRLDRGSLVLYVIIFTSI